MNYFFWQNTNSFHQSSFLEALYLCEHHVTLIVTEPLSQHRKNMGWVEPTLEDVTVIKAYDDESIPYELIEPNSHDVHVFFGISAFRRVHKAFLWAIQQKARIGIFTEPLDFRGFKGILRNIRGFWHKSKYAKHIAFVLTTGKQGVSQFENWGYDKNKVYEWAYTVQDSTEVLSASQPIEIYNIVYVGSLLHLKGYDILINAVKQLQANVQLHLYCYSAGEKNQVESIKRELNNVDNIHLYPFLSNNEIRKKIPDYDLLVLPSRYDGWGVVINESLAEGTPVIVSSRCGSSTLINNEKLGDVISTLHAESLKKMIENRLKRGKINRETRNYTKEWARNHISGHAMSTYLERIIDYIDGHTAQKPSAPWK